MPHKFLGFAAAAVALCFFSPVQATAQQWKAPRTPDGKPDLQGFWSNNSATPLQRPAELAGRTSLTNEEVVAMRKKAAELFDGRGDAAFGDNVFQTVLTAIKESTTGPHKRKVTDADGTGDYSSEWILPRDWDNRTSLITDPPDGRLPAMTAQAQARRPVVGAVRRTPEDMETLPLQERCVHYGSPQLTAGYQSYYQVVQTPGSVMVMTEMIHDARIIPLDGRSHVPSSVRQWHGDSVGHWEGDTLVVDTVNYKARSFMSTSSEKLHVVERFTRTEAEVLQYQITIDDPDTWTKPWTLMVPLRRTSNPVLEYACHEGNSAMTGIMAGARAQERAAALTGSPEQK